jgi:hypothetical protein
VGYPATDGEIVRLLKMVGCGEEQGQIAAQVDLVRKRVSDYQYEYMVYNEIIILDANGAVHANLDPANTISHSGDPLLSKTMAIDLHDTRATDKYLETYWSSDL